VLAVGSRTRESNAAECERRGRSYWLVECGSGAAQYSRPVGKRRRSMEDEVMAVHSNDRSVAERTSNLQLTSSASFNKFVVLYCSTVDGIAPSS